MSLKHQDAGKSAHPINVGEARWSSGCRGHGSPGEFGIGSIRQRSIGESQSRGAACPDRFCEEPTGKPWAKKTRAAFTPLGLVIDVRRYRFPSSCRLPEYW